MSTIVTCAQRKIWCVPFHPALPCPFRFARSSCFYAHTRVLDLLVYWLIQIDPFGFALPLRIASPCMFLQTETFRCPTCNIDLCINCAMSGEVMERSSAPECPPRAPSQAHSLDPTEFCLQRPPAVAADTTEVVPELFDWHVDNADTAGVCSDGFSTWHVQPVDADSNSGGAAVPQGWWEEHCIADVLLVLDGEQLPGEGYERVAMLGASALGEYATLSAITSSDESDTEANQCVIS